MDKPLLKNHRTMGYEVGRIPAPDLPGRELVVLQTGPEPLRDLQTAPAHTLMPVQPLEPVLALRVEVAEAIERAQFFGADPVTIYEAILAELAENGVKPPEKAKKRRATRDSQGR